MKTKSIPAIIMLLAGLIACLSGINAHMEAADFMKQLFVVLIIFYILGCIVEVIIEKNFVKMQEEETTDGEETGEDESNRTKEDETAETESEDE